MNLDALNVIEKDAEPLKRAALGEVDEMVTVTSNTMFEMVSGLTWGLVSEIFNDKIKEIVEHFDLFQGVIDQIFNDLSNIVDEFGKPKLYDAYKGYTASEEIKIIEQDISFDDFIMDRVFKRDDNIIQVFKEGESAIREIMESGEIQKQRDRYEDCKRLDESWWTFGIPKIGMVGSAFSMVASLPYTASEVTSKHSSILSNAKYFIIHQTSSDTSVLSISTGSQTTIGKDTKIAITVDKKASKSSEPIIGIVVSPDGRIIDMNLYQTNPYASNYETLSSSTRLPHQPGKYKMLAMTYNDMMKSSVQQVETTQIAPNISVSISTDKQFYNSSETVTITANFTNNAPEKVKNLTYSIDVLNTTYNKTGFLEIDACLSKIETLSFVPKTNGTYKAIVTIFIELYLADFAETGFTVESGRGVFVNIDSKDVYDPNTNVTANFTIKNIRTELYQGNIAVTTVDTLNDYQEVYNSIELLSVNESEEKVLPCIILPKESSTPGIYRSYIGIDNSTYIVPFTVAANGTIFITVQADKLIYSDFLS